MAKRLLVLCCLAALSGCGARTEVAKDKILAQVDALLGEIDVKRKDAEIGVKNMEAAIDQLVKGKIEAKVRQNQISGKIAEVEGKIANADKALAKVRDYLKENKDVTISGKTFTADQLKEMADKAIAARKKLAAEAESLKGCQDRLGSVVASLDQREQQGRDKLKAIKQNLDEIDTKAVALKSIKEASTLSGGVAAPDFETLEKQVRDLSTRIDTDLAFHDEKAKEVAANETSSLDTIIRQTSTTSDTLSEINMILGDK